MLEAVDPGGQTQTDLFGPMSMADDGQSLIVGLVDNGRQLFQSHLVLIYQLDDIDTGLAISDRIAMIHEGFVIFTGTPDELRASEDPRVRAAAVRALSRLDPDDGTVHVHRIRRADGGPRVAEPVAVLASGGGAGRPRAAGRDLDREADRREPATERSQRVVDAHNRYAQLEVLASVHLRPISRALPG